MSRWDRPQTTATPACAPTTTPTIRPSCAPRGVQAGRPRRPRQGRNDPRAGGLRPAPPAVFAPGREPVADPPPGRGVEEPNRAGGRGQGPGSPAPATVDGAKLRLVGRHL